MELQELLGPWCGVSPRRSGFNPRRVREGFVWWTQWHWDGVFSEYFGFTLSGSFNDALKSSATLVTTSVAISNWLHLQNVGNHLAGFMVSRIPHFDWWHFCDWIVWHEKLTQKRPVREAGSRWKDNINMNHKVCADCILWLRIGTDSGVLWIQSWNWWGITHLIKRLLAS
jgi:hypothetical protein